MASTTSSIPIPTRRGVSAVGAALLAIAGNVLVVVIAAGAVAGVAVAAFAVFGSQLLAAL